MANLHLVTGYGGFDHVTAADDGSLNAAIFGSGSYVLNRGNCLNASAITSNVIRIKDGDILMNGRHVRLNEGTYVDLTIANGAQGMKRNDLIVCRYTKNTGTGIEECNLVVIKGSATSGTPSDPSYTEGDVLAGNATQSDFPLYRVHLDGLNIAYFEPLFRIIEGLDCEVLPVHKGGTGSSIASEARANLGITPENIGAAKSSHNHTLSGLSGVLPISKGGTGATTKTEAIENLGACRVYGTVYTGNGETGNGYKTEVELPFIPRLVFIKGQNADGPGVFVIDQESINNERQTFFDYATKSGGSTLDGYTSEKVPVRYGLRTNSATGGCTFYCYSLVSGNNYQFNGYYTKYSVIALG